MAEDSRTGPEGTAHIRVATAARAGGDPSAEPGAPGTPFDSAVRPSDALRIQRLADAPHRAAAITVGESGRTRIEDELRLSADAVARQVMRDGVPLAYEPAAH
ncbi:hypothetical protein [Streptomyces sp. NPDC051211]|uniref:hypothetical protein n=1 Tax=Streptomyces sp. NPDC051211 TaxID=3154643 RepID=UPI00344EF383